MIQASVAATRTGFLIAAFLLCAGPKCLCAPQSSAAPPAQAAGPAARKLNLAAALDLASRQNLDLAAARLQRAVAAAGIRIAKEIPNPSVSFSASRDAPHQSLFFDQPLEIGGQRGRRVDVANQEIALTDVEVRTVEREVRRKTREGFYGVALAKGSTAQFERALALAQRLQDIAKARFQAGDVPELEVFQADLQVSRAQADVEVARQRERTALSALNALLNEPPETQWEIAGSLEDLPPDSQLADLIQRAAAANYDLQHLAQELKVEDSHHALLRAERVPDLDVQAGVDMNSPGDYRFGPRGQLSIGLPIFSRNQGELAQSAATENLLQANITAARRSVSGEVEQAYYTFASFQTEVRLYQKTLLPMGRRLESLAEESYRAGKENFLFVLDAQRNVQQLEQEYLTSLFELQTAFAELEEIVGESLD